MCRVRPKHARLFLILVALTLIHSACIVTRLQDPYERLPRPTDTAAPDRPAPVHITTIFEQSPAFRKLDRTSFKVRDERHAKRRLSAFVQDNLIASGAFRSDPGSSLKLVIRLRLIDETADADGHRWNTFLLLLNIATLCVVPAEMSIPETIQITLERGHRTLSSRTYSYGRRGTMSWLAIPFNLLVTSWHPGFAMGAHGINLEHALPRLGEKIRADARTLAGTLDDEPAAEDGTFSQQKQRNR